MQIDEKLNEILTDILPEDKVLFEVHDGYVNFALKGKRENLSMFDVEGTCDDESSIPEILADMAEVIENVAKPAINDEIFVAIKEGCYTSLDDAVEDCENINDNADYAIESLNEKAQEIKLSICKDESVREKLALNHNPHLYRTNEDDMVVIANESMPLFLNAEQIKAYDEYRLLNVHVYGSFPYDNKSQWSEGIEIDKPITDGNDLEKVGKLVDMELKKYVGEMDIEELVIQSPRVVETGKFDDCNDFDIEIFNRSPLPKVTIRIPEVLEELGQKPYRFDHEDVIDSMIHEIDPSVGDKYHDWQKEIVVNELNEALCDFENEHKHLIKDDIER